jgi:hypothetical protein
VVDSGPSPAALALAAFLRGAGSVNAPTQAAVERALGRADVAREDGAGAALTYRLESCALMLLFAADAQNAKRLAETYPGPRRAGAAAPDLETCASEALARGARGVSRVLIR